MQNFKKSFDQLVSEKPSQLILGIIFVFYILFNVHTPPFLAGAVDNLFGKVLVVVIAGVIFMKTNPVIGVLGFVVAYQMIKTASVTTGTYAMKHFLPSESSKMREMQTFNQDRISTQPIMQAQQMQSQQMQAQHLQQEELLTKTNNAGLLEVEMVAQMAPLVMSGGESDLHYSPVLAAQHSATLLHED
jgi:hypothetical protein